MTEQELIEKRKEAIKNLEQITKNLRKVCQHKNKKRTYDYSRSSEAYNIPYDNCQDCGMWRSGSNGQTNIDDKKWRNQKEFD